MTKSDETQEVVVTQQGSKVARRRSADSKKCAAADVKPRKNTESALSAASSSKKTTRSSTANATGAGSTAKSGRASTQNQRAKPKPSRTTTSGAAVEHVKRKSAKKTQSMRDGIVRTLSTSSAAKAAAALLLTKEDLEEMDEPLIVNGKAPKRPKQKSNATKKAGEQTNNKKKKDRANNNVNTTMEIDSDEDDRLNRAILAAREEERQVQQAIQQSLELERRQQYAQSGRHSSLEDFDLELQKGIIPTAASGSDGKPNRVRQMMIDANRQASMASIGFNDATETSRWDEDVSPSSRRGSMDGSDVRVTRVSPTTGRRKKLHHSKALPKVYCCCLSKAAFCGLMFVVNAIIVSVTVAVLWSHFGQPAGESQSISQGPAAMRGDDMDSIIPYDEYPSAGGGGSTSTTTSASEGTPPTNNDIPVDPMQPMAAVDLPPILHVFDDQQATTLPLLSPLVMTQPYDSADALDYDVTVAAKRLVETYVQRQLLYPAVWLKRALARNVGDEEPIAFVDSPLTSFDSESSVPRPAFVPPQYPNGDVAEWEATLQALGGIQPGDPQVQVDSVSGRIFLAKGDTLSVHGSSTAGNNTILPLATVTLPPISNTDSSSGTPPRETWLLQEARDLGSQQQQVWTPLQPRATIEQVLLTPDGQYVVCVVSGYGPSLERLQRGSTSSPPLIQDYLRTQVITYHVVVNLGVVELQQVGQWHNVHGTVVYAHATNGQVQLVTTTAVDTDRFLANPYDRSYYPDYSDADYVADLRETASGKYVPEFTQRLKVELGDSSSQDLNLWRLNRWQKLDSQQMLNNNGDDRLGAQLQAMEDMVLAQSSGDGGVLHHLVLLTSLQIQSASVSTVAFFTPSSSLQVIPAPSGRLLLFASGWGWKGSDSEDPTMEPVTHVLSLEPSSDAMVYTQLRGIGTVRGHVLGSDSKRCVLDAVAVINDEVRIATSLRKHWRLEPIQWSARGRIVREEWVLEKYLSVLSLDTLEEEQPALRLGSVSEDRIMAVKYFSETSDTSTNNIAYVIPRDPSNDVTSVLQFDKSSTASSPIQILGQVSLPGFSQYIHVLPPNDGNGNLIVSIGQHIKPEDGVFTGWMISLWDAANPAQPQVVTQYQVDGDESENSGKPIQSLTRWDAQTFRVASTGQLILPLSTEYFRNPDVAWNTSLIPDPFDGFVVYNLSPTGITEFARIPHSRPSTAGNNILCPGYSDCPLNLSPRSARGDGTSAVVTMDGATVTNTNLETGQQQWQFEVN